MPPSAPGEAAGLRRLAAPGPFGPGEEDERPAAPLRRLLPGLRAAAGMVLDALLPPLCLTCRAPVTAAGTHCADCARGLNPTGALVCDRCGVSLGSGLLAERAEDGRLICPACHETPPGFATARAALIYDDAAKRLILPLKYARRTDLARWLARRMAAAAPELLERAEVLVPVPLHWRRLMARGYNQAALLAGHLGRQARRPVAHAALRRLRATPPLGERGAADRAALLEGVFAVPERQARRIAGRRVLLVDDVLTSGATASACARALLAAGAARVDAIAVARVPHPAIQAMDGGAWP
ncbi:MAG: ComF family protein [Acetobacteraceae bacterium]